MNFKKVTMALVAILFTATAYAQTPQRVYDQIYRSSYKVASDKSEDTEIRKIASFRVDAISYLKTKTLEALSVSDKELTGKEVAHKDDEVVLAYYNREDYPTQFSLDTNWIAALEEVKRELK